MKLADFTFELPDELIARFPASNRTDSRLLALNSKGDVSHQSFKDLLNYLNAGDLMVFNNTKVIPARLLGNKESGGKVEVLVERVLNSKEVLAHVRANKSPKPGNLLILENAIKAEMLGREGDLFHLRFLDQDSVLSALEQHGHMPLPPYIDRKDELSDKERYQTVYGEKPGAVAAPTAGLHFDDEFLQQIKDKGVEIAFVTLHVGAGTFLPVRVDDIEKHTMHSEYAEICAETADKIVSTKQQGNRVIAVGTTSVRTLESAAKASSENLISQYAEETDIFIYPGFEFKVVDAMVTNFHLPESTLIMLVSAFSSKDNILKAYNDAVANQYRFFSYGDAMFIEKAQKQN